MATEVHRRLVKSPPELWAEVSDPESLGRRLAEFGEIRITRVEPETIVAWEGERAGGTIEIGSSGWGTAVRMTAEPVLPPAPDPSPPAPPPAPTPPPPAPAPTPPPPAPDPVPPPPAPAPIPPPPGPAPAPPTPIPGPDPPSPDPVPPAARRGFFARLFGRAPEEVPELASPPSQEVPAPPVPDPAPLPEPDPVPEPEPAPLPEPEIVVLPEPAPEPEPDPGPAPAAGLDADEVRAVLERALDDLGAAHHRPFSRG